MTTQESQRRPLISANWKMNLNHFEAIQTVQKIFWALEPDQRFAEVCLHVPFTDLRSVQTVLEADDMPMVLGAQNSHWEDGGAFTGEVSPAMLAKLHVSYVLIGHSERRQFFNETYDLVAKKAAALHRNGVVPIICVGEALDEREAGRSEDVVTEQVSDALSMLNPEQVAKSIVAYEPIWAISTSSAKAAVATPEDAQSMCGLIRSLVANKWGEPAGEQLRIQYGGSVSAGNAAELLAQDSIDGLLVGSASLVPDDFARIVAAAGRSNG